jgi:polysaccharide biosynthesis transport protein
VTDEHPEVKRLESMIAATEKSFHDNDAKVAAGYVTLLQLRLEGAQQKAAELRATVAAQEQQIRSVSPAQAEYQAIEARYDRARKIADVLYNQVRTLDINERLDAARKVELNTLVYEHAAPSSATVASSKRTLVAIATFLGLILGTGLAWLRSLVDQRLRTPEDVAGQVPLLATLPRIGRSSDIRETWRKVPEFAAAMRSLRTVIQFGVRSERNRILQITSPLERGSNSIITAGLGVAMAQAGDRTLIIDADLDRAQQANLFNIDNDVGFVQVLAGRVTAAAAVVETSVPNLRILPVGALSPDLGVLFGDSPLAEVLRQLGADYDRILIDSPPLLVDTDARIIAAVSDESLLVIRSARTTRKLVKSALNLIASVAGRIAGAVLEGSSDAAAIGISADVHPPRGGSAGPRPERLQRAANIDLDTGRTANTQ